ncbi:uncharacterized protein LOC108667742 [Hyalella azteca]|uniref:Uncharacterized protein LOC108667742 n=1 Tax=Hyalella azteca TaxID=294128 RepID=A0A8B7N8Y2_HYAAZ|nr:uncharacterized protein LOC108667742 [Hyalella azteca]
MTGLGLRRQRTKIKFDNSPACIAIEQALGKVPEYSQEPRANVKNSIRLALKGAIDWLGHRGRRKNATGETANRPTPIKILTPSRVTRSQAHFVAPDPPSDGPDFATGLMRTVACERALRGSITFNVSRIGYG